MKKTIILFLSVCVALFVFGRKPAFTAEDESTFRNEWYGIEFSLPAPRWRLTDLPEENTSCICLIAIVKVKDISPLKSRKKK